MDKKRKASLTNETIAKKFPSIFELVNYSIRLAENMIKTGRDPRVKSESNNKALLVIDEIAQNVDKFDEIIEQVHQDVVEESKYFKKADELMLEKEVPKEKKKNRRMTTV